MPKKQKAPAPRRHRCAGVPWCTEPSCPNDNYRSPLEVEVEAALREVLARLLPKGGGKRAEFNERPFLGLRVVCAGAKPDMAYWCCLKPGHEGRCFSRAKVVDFTPDTYG